MHYLQSVDEVLTALGPRELKKLARRFDLTRQAMDNWRIRRQLPARYYLIMQAKLAIRGFRSDPSIWGIERPP